ncbi:MAG: M56 family metallopeptidase [Dehalococcoidia bacterium]
MRRRIWSLAALGLALMLLAAPVATWHALANNGRWFAHLDMQACTDAGILFSTGMGIVVFVPVARVAAMSVEVLMARRLLRSLQVSAEPRASAGVRYWAIPLDTVTFFTAGIRSPRIYASTSAEHTLPPAVFEAALLHELAHCKRGDVWRNVVLGIIDGAGGWLPGVRSALRSFRLRAEHAADNDAIAAGASRRDLFEAIVSVCAPAMPGAVAMSEGNVVPRLEYLAGAPWTPPKVVWRASVSVVLWSVVLPVAAHVVAVTGLVCLS